MCHVNRLTMGKRDVCTALGLADHVARRIVETFRVVVTGCISIRYEKHNGGSILRRAELDDTSTTFGDLLGKYMDDRILDARLQ